MILKKIIWEDNKKNINKIKKSKNSFSLLEVSKGILNSNVEFYLNFYDIKDIGRTCFELDFSVFNLVDYFWDLNIYDLKRAKEMSYNFIDNFFKSFYEE